MTELYKMNGGTFRTVAIAFGLIFALLCAILGAAVHALKTNMFDKQVDYRIPA